MNKSILLLLCLAINWGTSIDSFAQDANTIQKLDPDIASLIDSSVADQIKSEKVPGAVVCIGTKDEIRFLKAYGNRQLQPALEKMTVDTVFDLASLTKPIATATSIMILLEQGKVRLRGN